MALRQVTADTRSWSLPSRVLNHFIDAIADARPILRPRVFGTSAIRLGLPVRQITAHDGHGREQSKQPTPQSTRLFHDLTSPHREKPDTDHSRYGFSRRPSIVAHAANKTQHRSPPAPNANLPRRPFAQNEFAEPFSVLRAITQAYGVCLLAVLFFSPHVVAWRAWGVRPDLVDQRETGRAAVALWQVDHLGEPVEDKYQFIQRRRFLFPAVARALRLPPALHLALYPAGAFLAVAYLPWILQPVIVGWWLLAVLTAFAANAWFFTSTGWLGGEGNASGPKQSGPGRSPRRSC
jgi:hypothetical protein